MKKILFVLVSMHGLLNASYVPNLESKLNQLNQLLVSLANSLEAISTAAAAKKQIFTPSSIWGELSEGKSLSRSEKIKLFISDTQSSKKENEAIPIQQQNPNTVRIMSYNVHYWTDPMEKNNLDAILKTIQLINPDIVLLQEVSARPEIVTKFRQLGYAYGGNSTFCKAAILFDLPFGNIIFSKYPIANSIDQVYSKSFGAENRCYSNVIIELPNNKSISIYVTHFDVFDVTGATRLEQAKELINNISNDTHDNILVAADFNSVRKKDYNYMINNKLVWDLLKTDNLKRFDQTPTDLLEFIEDNNYKDTFTLGSSPGPKYTTWNGTVIDFIYLNKKWTLPISGSYIYFDSASDHLPVVVDFRLN